MKLNDFERAADVLEKLGPANLRTLADLAGLKSIGESDRYIAEQLAMLLGTTRPATRGQAACYRSLLEQALERLQRLGAEYDKANIGPTCEAIRKALGSME